MYKGKTGDFQTAFEYEYSFLSDILKVLSVELYQFKRFSQELNPNRQLMDASENRIGALISGMLRFSDCRNELVCGYAEYRGPRNSEERSMALTAIATSLLCEAAASSRIICGSLSFLLQSFLEDWGGNDISIDELIDLDRAVDREWFLKALLLQVSRDCAAYECVKSDEAWLKLVLSLYSIDEEWKWDIRTIAALAFMGTNATSEIMRIKMISMTNGRTPPFWNAGQTLPTTRSKNPSSNGLSATRRSKSGDVLVNALGILAFISSGAHKENIEWDLLANWLYEQQSKDGSFENAIDTYFASRALFEYGFRRKDVNENGNNLTMKIRCPSCETHTLNVTENANEIYIPTQARNLTFETEGHGKAIVGIRVVARKRQRSRRGLDQDDPHTARITVDQQRVSKGTLRQIVCICVMSEVIKTIEITHGLYTGYSATPNSVILLSNSTSVSIVSLPTISSFAVHFVLDGFRRNEAQCYEIGITEPSHSHEPFHLAPVAITARHPLENVIGLVLISHPDQDYVEDRIKRELVEVHQQSASYLLLSRIRRGIVDDSIDTVCFQGGALLRVLGTKRVLVGNSFYTRLTTEIREKQGGAKQKISDKLHIWLRDCNPRCIVSSPMIDEKFFIIGEAEALVSDSFGRLHYVLRDVDRFEKATINCGVLSNIIILGS
ncbi:hypothetical protein DICVIV_13654 [Dictyocaulus viviparus]|uniref:Alpha-macroglobulin-like TED domain-containing protein n=1 Tax=Dictyocaulus viviparus TaxID=29172 RepID=A0A0D8X9T7_DICVI|nr:hypothetical protein DICVIV_13654 [Dictyocaulus viviparus]